MKTFTSRLLQLARMSCVVWLLGFIAIVSAPTFANAQNDCTANTADHTDLANKIAHGHAFTKHSAEFVKGAEKAGLKFPDPTIGNADAFATFLKDILDDPDVSRGLSNGRTAHWDSRTGTVIIYNPIPADCGTAFRPDLGKAYFDDLK